MASLARALRRAGLERIELWDTMRNGSDYRVLRRFSDPSFAIHEVPELVSIVIPELRIAKAPYRILQIIHARRPKC